jgi:hypothetical protein
MRRSIIATLEDEAGTPLGHAQAEQIEGRHLERYTAYELER